MAEEIDGESGRISNFEELVTLTLDRVILYIVVHRSKTPDFIEIEETFCGRTDVRRPTHGRTDIWDRLYQVDSVAKSRPENAENE